MPSIDPSQMIFDSISGLTGGLISDIQTLVLAALVIAFIVAGFDILLSALGAVISSRSRDNSFETAKDLLDARNSHQRGTAEWDKLNLQYRRYLRKSI